MPLIIPDNDTDKYFIVGVDDDGLPGAVLDPADSISAPLSADPATVVLTPDPTPLVTDADFVLASGVKVPKGTQTIGSGTISVPKPPAQPNVAIGASYFLTIGGAVQPTVSDTITVQPGKATSSGILFDQPVPVAA